MSKQKQAFYWTRKLELDLVAFVKQRPYIWKAAGNTNHDIKRKYKAYAEFAALLDRGFTARSVRDRWVNIRSTFNHYLRKVERSVVKDDFSSKTYIPCWPLWKPLQFLRENSKLEEGIEYDTYPQNLGAGFRDQDLNVKSETTSENEDTILLKLRQSNHRTDRPRHKTWNKTLKPEKYDKCKMVINDLVMALKPVTELSSHQPRGQSYWFFGKHVTERLNEMSAQNADSAGWEILRLIDEGADEKI